MVSRHRRDSDDPTEGSDRRGQEQIKLNPRLTPSMGRHLLLSGFSRCRKLATNIARGFLEVSYGWCNFGLPFVLFASLSCMLGPCHVMCLRWEVKTHKGCEGKNWDEDQIKSNHNKN